MALKDIVKVTRKTYFNPRGWFDYDNFKAQTLNVVALFKQVFRPVFNPTTAGHAETFHQAVQRYKLTEHDLAQISRNYLIFAIFFLLLSVGLLALCLYYLLHFHFLAAIVTVGIMVLMLAQAFKYHFWHFQIKQRKLGCTFEEWRRGIIGGGKPHD